MIVNSTNLNQDIRRYIKTFIIRISKLMLFNGLALVSFIILYSFQSFAHLKVNTSEQKPNVIFILSDDQGYGEMGCHGNPRIQTPNRQGVELYDIQNDPREEKNLADEHPEMVKEMQAELRKWQESVLNSLTGADYE